MKQSSLKKILRQQNIWLLSGTLIALVIGIVAAGVISTVHNYRERNQQLGERVKSLNSIFAREALLHSFHTLDFELNRLQTDFHLQSITFGGSSESISACGSDVHPNIIGANAGSILSWPVVYGSKVVGCIEAKLEPLDLGFKIDASLLTPVGLTAIVMTLLLMGYRRNMLNALIIPMQELHTQAEAIAGIKGVFRINSDVEEFKRLETMLNQMLARVNESTLKVTEYEREASKVQVARQVAHDIRSPLSALMMLTSNATELSEPKRLLLKNAVARINDIANTLQSRSKPVKEPEMRVESLAFCIEEIISEKRALTNRLGIALQFEVQPEHFNMFSYLQPTEFKRVLSNVVNNAIEALGNRGLITVELRPLPSGHRAQVIVRDTGCGIPQDIIERVFDNSFSYKKPEGSGLGLYHAREQIRRIKGDIRISSVEGVGTTVSIELPMATPPSFWCREIQTADLKRVVIVDDSQSVHDVWRARFADVGGGRTGIGTRRNKSKFLVESISSLEEFTSRLSEIILHSNGNDTLFLVDYEFAGADQNGLDAIAQIAVTTRIANVILVTSHAHELPVVERCKKLGIRLLPKSLIGLVPVSTTASVASAAAVAATTSVAPTDHATVTAAQPSPATRRSIV